MKNKIISIRIDEETFKRLKKTKIDINKAVRKELSKLADATHCPICGQRVNEDGKKWIDV